MALEPVSQQEMGVVGPNGMAVPPTMHEMLSKLGRVAGLAPRLKPLLWGRLAA
jgi:putative exporter of polyketide antibiotics